MRQFNLIDESDTITTLPDDTQRLVIVGTTGSGKTHAGAWHLSMRNYTQKPWIVYDWKRDPLLGSIQNTFPLLPSAPAPEDPGLYLVQPKPGRDDEAVENQMDDIWNKEDIGVFVDECYMIPKNSQSFRNLLTQGRSKHIPMIICTQRPVWVDRFVFTESEFKQIFRLQSSDDMKTLGDNVPKKPLEYMAERYPLAGRDMKYWSYYYDGVENELRPMRPVPDADVIRSMFHAKLARLKRVV